MVRWGLGRGGGVGGGSRCGGWGRGCMCRWVLGEFWGKNV